MDIDYSKQVNIYLYSITILYIYIDLTEFTIDSFKYLLNTEMIIKSENEILKHTVEFFINYDNSHLDEGILSLLI